MNPPKIACTPIIFVTNEDINTRDKVITTIITVGPLSLLPVLTISFNKIGRIANITINTQATAKRKTYNAMSELEALMMVTTKANKTHAATSSPTPAVRAVDPTGVRRS
jgi:hypothetical protein